MSHTADSTTLLHHRFSIFSRWYYRFQLLFPLQFLYSLSHLFKRWWEFVYLQSPSADQQKGAVCLRAMPCTAAVNTRPNGPCTQPHLLLFGHHPFKQHWFEKWFEQSFFKLRSQVWGRLHEDIPWHPELTFWHASPYLSSAGFWTFLRKFTDSWAADSSSYSPAFSSRQLHY